MPERNQIHHQSANFLSDQAKSDKKEPKFAPFKRNSDQENVKPKG